MSGVSPQSFQGRVVGPDFDEEAQHESNSMVNDAALGVFGEIDHERIECGLSFISKDSNSQ